MGDWQSLVGFTEARTSAFELHGRWAARVTGCGQPGFYFVERGALVVTLRDQRFHLGSGDLLLIPRSSDHVLGTGDDSAVVPVEEITARARRCGELFVVGQGRSGLRLRSAAFLGPPLTFGWLPTAVMLNRSIGRTPLRHMTMALIEEMQHGTHAALCPLSEAVFVAALDEATKAAHLDMALLAAMNQARMAPGQFPSVSALAKVAGLSRSRLSERFAHAFGEPPMRWLRRLRMQAARACFAEGRCSVAQVAEKFDYSSESAFRKAYRRALGESATTFRHRHRRDR